MNNLKALLVGWMIAGLLLLGSPLSAQAAIVGTEQALSSASRAADIAQTRAFLNRADVRKQLVDWGVSPQQASERVASLTDEELQQLSQSIQRQPAAGDGGIFVVLGVVFLVLLVLDLTGVVHIFRH